jgi:hypothetical protein
MQDLGPAPAPLKPEEIIAQFGQKGGALDQLFEAAKEPQFELERTVQVRKARYNWKMVAGDQFAVPGFASDGNGQEIVDFVSNDYSSDPDQGGAQVAATFPINVLGGDCYKFVAVMGQSAPRVKAVADDPEDKDQLRVAHDADAVLRDAWLKLQVDKKWRTLAFHQFTTGPTYIHTPFVTDRVKYGQSTEPKITVQQQQQPDGSIAHVPAQDGVQTYPNGDVELHIYTVLEVSHPYGIKELEEAGWLQLEVMENRYKLLSLFPDELEQYRDSDPPDEDFGASAAAASEARDAVGNPSGIGRPKKSTDWRFRQLWVRPWMLEAIK